MHSTELGGVTSEDLRLGVKISGNGLLNEGPLFKDGYGQRRVFRTAKRRPRRVTPCSFSSNAHAEAPQPQSRSNIGQRNL